MSLLLCVCQIVGFTLWWKKAPQFGGLIICLIAVISSAIVYFIILRGIFLNKNAGYFIDDTFLVYKDGFPYSKKSIIKISQITSFKLKTYKKCFLICGIIVFAVGLIASFVLAALIKLNVWFVILIQVAAFLTYLVFILLHFLSKDLANLHVYFAEKVLVLKNVPIQSLKEIMEDLEKKGVKNEV